MKVLILAGGLGTRLAEETGLKPKPMVEIGGRPILWHIMKIYAHYGFSDFIILTGYKGHIIKEYFLNYYTHYSDITIDLADNSLQIHANRHEPWRVTLLYTGQDSQTGGRILHAKPYINNESFMLTYGDGLSDINLHALLDFHRSHKGAMTMTSVLPEGRFGALEIEPSTSAVKTFVEKPRGDASAQQSGWINGGFFVCEARVLEYIESAGLGDMTILEQGPLKNLAKDGQLYTYQHSGFWKCMDTLKDKNDLTQMWLSSQAPWAVW